MAAFLFSPSPGWSRQTEHATAPAMPSASSFSSRHSLIPEVIRLRKAALKIKKRLSCFSALLPRRVLGVGRQYPRRLAKRCAVLSSRACLCAALAAGRTALKTSFHRECSHWFSWEKQEVGVQKVLKWGCMVLGKGILIISNTDLRGETHFILSPIYFLVTPVCIGCFFFIMSSLFVCERLSVWASALCACALLIECVFPSWLHPLLSPGDCEYIWCEINETSTWTVLVSNIITHHFCNCCAVCTCAHVSLMDTSVFKTFFQRQEFITHTGKICRIK